MDNSELWEAQKILKEGRARITWASPNYFIFKIDTSEGPQEVYLRIKDGKHDWSCNITWQEKDRKWGCVFHTGPTDKPYCRHTLACKILYERWEDENQWKPK